MANSSESCSFVLYIDEAGDDGLKSFKPEDPRGCTEWLCLAGYLVRSDVDTRLPDLHAELRKHIGATQADALHYRNLSDKKRLAACKFLSTSPARIFVLCSYKRTLQHHRNDRVVASTGGSSQFLYNWLSRLLLERATEFVVEDPSYKAQKGFLKVVFSHRGGHRFGQMKAYIEQLKAQAIGKTTWLKRREIRPEVLRFQHIVSVPHYQLAGLQFADVVASAFYQGLDCTTSRWSIEPAVALSPLVAREKVHNRKLIPDFGVTLLPQPSRFILPVAQRPLFEAYGYMFDNPHGFR